MTFPIVIDSDYRYSAKDSFHDGDYEIDIDQFLFFVDGCLVFTTTISRSSFKSADGKIQNDDHEISMNIDDFVVARPGIWGNILIEALAHLELSIDENEQNAEILRKTQYLRNIEQDFSELH